MAMLEDLMKTKSPEEQQMLQAAGTLEVVETEFKDPDLKDAEMRSNSSASYLGRRRKYGRKTQDSKTDSGI